MSQAYQQIKNLNSTLPPTRTKDCSSTTVRMLYGVSLVPETFQRNIMMENLLQNIPFVIFRVDNIHPEVCGEVRNLWRRSLKQPGRSLETSTGLRLEPQVTYTWVTTTARKAFKRYKTRVMLLPMHQRLRMCQSSNHTRA